MIAGTACAVGLGAEPDGAGGAGRDDRGWRRCSARAGGRTINEINAAWRVPQRGPSPVGGPLSLSLAGRAVRLTLPRAGVGVETARRAQQPITAALVQKAANAYRFERGEVNIEDAKANGGELTTAGLLRNLSAAYYGSSESVEWFTPARYIEAARAVLGGIDLDPASTPIAQETVREAIFYTVEDDGLTHKWPGRVWLNPPYGGEQVAFVARLLDQYTRGITRAAIVLLSAPGASTAWFKPLWDYTLCFTDHRIAFESPAGPALNNTGGSVFVYLGPEPKRFAAEFGQFGPIVRRWPTAPACPSEQPVAGHHRGSHLHSR